MIPVKYNLRSLWARKVGSMLTILITSIVVMSSIFAFGLYAGLEHTLEVAANPLDVMVLRQGSSSETASAVSDAMAREILALPGIATDQDGTPLAAPELVVIGYLPRRVADAPKEESSSAANPTARRAKGGYANVTVRGVLPMSWKLRDGMTIVEGRAFKQGLREAIVSRAMAERFEGLGLGEEFEVSDGRFKVVGIFDAGGGATESEVWVDQKVLGQVSNRTGAVSSVQLRAASTDHRQSLISLIVDDPQIALKAITEERYYADQVEQGLVIRVLGQIVAFFLTLGAMFAVANTMYGAIASRAREIGTLRALGFGRASILIAFLLESLVLCLLGAAVGCAVAMMLPEIRTGTMNGGTFTEIAFSFNFGPAVLLNGAILAVVMGLLGGILPAIRAVRMKVVDALREV
jgi:putative ABC transport system permease protein